jgi:dihydroxyacetone synthase
MPDKPLPWKVLSAASKLEGSEQHGLVLGAFRCLVADLCEQFGGGHPG